MPRGIRTLVSETSTGTAAGDADSAAPGDADLAAAGDTDSAAPGDADLAAAGDADSAAPGDTDSAVYSVSLVTYISNML